MSKEVDDSLYKTVFDPTTLQQKGLCPVTHIRGQDNDPFESHSLYYEMHGHGPEKVLLIMGLNSTSFSWEPQVEHFGRAGPYTVLVFDNRGVGNSGTPKGPYTTSGMAEDAIALLDYVGWTEERGVNVVGTSLGGMIAMEMATRIPTRIASLTLCVTTAGGRPWTNLPPWKGFMTLTRLLTISDPNVKIPMILEMTFPKKHLDAKCEDDPQGRTNFEVQKEKYLRRAAHMRIQTPMGTLSQMSAGLTHHVTPDRLQLISRTIPKVLILTGDNDDLVNPANSAYLKSHMPEAEYQIFEETAHAIHLQHPKRYCELLERVFQEGRERSKTFKPVA